MGDTLSEIAQQLQASAKKVQLIYAFNGSGKTRLSKSFKELIAPKNVDGEFDAELETSRTKILYYNAFTEDLFYWDNDLERDAEPKLMIQPNSFTDWILKDQGQDQNIIANFQRYSNEQLTPRFNAEYSRENSATRATTTVKAYSEMTFSLERGDSTSSGNLKISKGEESSFIWSIFYALLDQVVSTLNVVEPSQRETDQFDQLQYVFIDDPVSSLDENHLIELAVNLAGLITSCTAPLKFILTTHNPLFYNVLYNELGCKSGLLLERLEDGSFSLHEKKGDANKSFSYHLYLKQTIERAISEDKVEKYHFTLLRNLYEKTAGFLGYPRWSELLPDDKQTYLKRVIQFTSHSNLSSEAVSEPTTEEKKIVDFLLKHLVDNFSFWQNNDSRGATVEPTL